MEELKTEITKDLVDEVMEELKTEKIITQTGFCKYCGQERIVEVFAHEDQETVDMMATDECDCPGAKAVRDRRSRVFMAQQNIQELFGQSNVSHWLAEGAELIGEGWMNGVTVDIGNGEKARLKITGKGAIIAQKIVTKQESMEA